MSDNTRRCTKCGEVKPLDLFSRSKTGSGGHKNKCKACSNADLAEWRAANREHVLDYDKRRRQSRSKEELNRHRAQQRAGYHRDPARHRDDRLKRNFKITLAEYNEMLNSQGGVCAICNQSCKTGRALAVDHDRSCCSGSRSCGECVRALLCANCNRAIGMFQDNPNLVQAAVDYLLKFKE